jgi:hypothetical protein
MAIPHGNMPACTTGSNTDRKIIRTEMVPVKPQVALFSCFCEVAYIPFHRLNKFLLKGVIFMLADYREEIEQMNRITVEGWGRL